jgi:signal transduction histidine kinase
MEERAVLAGGSLKIQSGPSGTEVRAAFREDRT